MGVLDRLRNRKPTETPPAAFAEAEPVVPADGAWSLTSIAPRFAARDRDATIRFYAVLGFRTKYDDGTGFLIFTRDEANIHVTVFDEGGTRSVCWIGVKDIRALYPACQRAGIVKNPLKDKPYGLTEFTVCDPFGNLILLAEPTSPDAGSSA